MQGIGSSSPCSDENDGSSIKVPDPRAASPQSVSTPSELSIPKKNIFKSVQKAKPASSKTHMPAAYPDSEFTHIIRYKDGVFELVCYVCRTSIGKNKKYFNGTRGYHRHVVSHSEEPGLTEEECIQRARERGGLRPVSEADMIRLGKGETPSSLKEPISTTRQVEGKKLSGTTAMALAAKYPVNSDATSRTLPQHPAQFQQLAPQRYPHIIYFNGEWTTVGCHICGATVCPNAQSPLFGRFWNGINHLASHMISDHDFDILPEGFNEHGWTKVAQKCLRHPLCGEDVERIKRGSTLR